MPFISSSSINEGPEEMWQQLPITQASAVPPVTPSGAQGFL